MKDWDLDEFASSMPISRRKYLCDIINCTGKTGDIVYEALVKQWGRLNLYPLECAGGVGDGGGENEGTHGVHSHIEQVNAAYVRRRCLLHLPWRVADQGLIEMGEVFDLTKAISDYLHNGSTWMRFKAIATQPIAQGGLALCTEGDAVYAIMFGKSPPKH